MPLQSVIKFPGSSSYYASTSTILSLQRYHQSVKLNLQTNTTTNLHVSSKDANMHLSYKSALLKTEARLLNLNPLGHSQKPIAVIYKVHLEPTAHVWEIEHIKN
jgi:hypothetical protein